MIPFNGVSFPTKLAILLPMCAVLQSCFTFYDRHANHPYNNRGPMEVEWTVSNAVFNRCIDNYGFSVEKAFKFKDYKYSENYDDESLKNKSARIRSAAQDVLTISSSGYEIEFVDENPANNLVFGNYYSKSPFPKWREHGADSWSIYLEPNDEGTIMNVSISSSLGEECVDISNPNEALFELFVNRVKYLIGEEKNWMSCEDQLSRIVSGEIEGDIALLCSHGGDDALPPSEWEASPPPDFTIRG